VLDKQEVIGESAMHLLHLGHGLHPANSDKRAFAYV